MPHKPGRELRLIKSRYYALSLGGRGKGEGEIRLNFHPHLNPPPHLYMNKVDSK